MVVSLAHSIPQREEGVCLIAVCAAALHDQSQCSIQSHDNSACKRAATRITHHNCLASFPGPLEKNGPGDEAKLLYAKKHSLVFTFCKLHVECKELNSCTPHACFYDKFPDPLAKWGVAGGLTLVPRFFHLCLQLVLSHPKRLCDLNRTFANHTVQQSTLSESSSLCNYDNSFCSRSRPMQGCK